VIEAVEALGRPAMRLRAPDGAQAVVLLHGAQIVSWVPAGDQERLYVSPLAGPRDARVRGGVPVVFPQFAARGPLPNHGFARELEWHWVEGAVRGGAAIGVLRLESDAATRSLWPHDFAAELTLSVSGLELEVELEIENTGATAFEFTAALHTYLSCDDLRRARLGGLYGVRYHDSVTGGEHRQELDPIGFAGEIDRIYFDVEQPLALSTAFGRMTIEGSGFPDVVVWNPGPERTAALADLPDDDWLRMLCVESACVGRTVRLAPGDDWLARQRLQA
jgi:glucose-6-phosphate 1-epimerase